ncbi:hypothetical protein R6Q57_026919 [Mikania cordata]
MQTPKTRAATLEVPPRTQKTARQLKSSVAEADNSSSLNPVIKTAKSRSPKLVDRRSPRTPTSEKKHPGRISELETQLASLQEELTKVRDELSQSESLKKRAHEEAEEAKKQLTEVSKKLQDSQQQLDEISASEESRLQELRKISQDRDRAWESELEAVKKHHSMDSVTLAAAMNEIQKLKMQLEKVVESEANLTKYAESAHDEMLKLRLELSETLAIDEELKTQIKDSHDSEARALEVVGQTREQLETIKSTFEILKSEKLEAMRVNDSIKVELEKSKAKVDSLEGIVSKLEMKNSRPAGDDNDVDQEEINSVIKEVEKLKEELEGAEKRYQEAYIQRMLQIRSAYELVEQTRTESCKKVSTLEMNLKKSIEEFEDLKAKYVEKEEKLQNITEENKILNEKLEKTKLATEIDTEDHTYLKKLEANLEDLKRVYLEKETELKAITEENETLKMEKNQVNQEAVAAAIVAEKESLLMKVGYLTEEVDKSGKKMERVTQQLDLAQAANAEMEAELRRLKIQTDQWRKAAEVAASMISDANNGKFVERTGSLDTHTIGGKLNSPLCEDIEDESPKKKNGNMLKKFGVFMKGRR